LWNISMAHTVMPPPALCGNRVIMADSMDGFALFFLF
jgi:hypothetical protein